MRRLLICAVVLGLGVAAGDARAQQQREILGRDFITYNDTQKANYVDKLKDANESAVALCAPGASDEQMAEKFTDWLTRNPDAGMQPAYVGFTQMLEDTCKK